MTEPKRSPHLRVRRVNVDQSHIDLGADKPGWTTPGRFTVQIEVAMSYPGDFTAADMSELLGRTFVLMPEDPA